MSVNPRPSRAVSVVERLLERSIFGSRWLLAPFYLGLAAALLVLMVKFVKQAALLFVSALSAGSSDIILGILSLIDLALMANLVLMVIIGGYESFVSRLDVEKHEGRLEWMGRIGFSEMKLKLLASIVAISGIHLLEGFMNMDHLSNRVLAWRVGIHMTFVVSGVLLAVMDRLSGGESH